MSSFNFAHLSDPHVALQPERPAAFGMRAKRLFSYASWRRRRRHIHRPEILAALVSDLLAHAPDHIAVTGDLTNLSLPSEFERTRSWLEALADPGRMTVVPGNHDTLVPQPWKAGLALWRPWMEGDRRGGYGADLFPAVRIRGCVGFVGLNSARPTRLFSAAGALGAAQIAAAEQALADLARRGLFRVVLIHHPIVEGAVSRRKALRDRAALLAALRRAGAELVLHGHTHRARTAAVAGPSGSIPVLAVPSASASASPAGDAARWHLISVRRTAGTWRATVTLRALARAADRFEEAGRFELAMPVAGHSSG